jgi:predicted N-acetyltransferase YhbS
MQSSDMPRVLAIQERCYTDIVPESHASLEAKLLASPSTCFIACLDDQIVGYIVSVPWTLGSPPALNSPECRIPASSDCLYLHDLAIDPDARKCGAGAKLVEACMACLATLDLQQASLIAIQASSPYWQRFGFRAVELGAAMRSKLATYGENVVYMEYAA